MLLFLGVVLNYQILLILDKLTLIYFKILVCLGGGGGGGYYGGGAGVLYGTIIVIIENVM